MANGLTPLSSPGKKKRRKKKNTCVQNVEPTNNALENADDLNNDSECFRTKSVVVNPSNPQQFSPHNGAVGTVFYCTIHISAMDERSRSGICLDAC